MTAVMTQAGARTVERDCPHSIEFGLDEADNPRMLPCTLIAGHRDPHMARFDDGDGAIGPAYVSAQGLIRWEAR